MISICMFLFYVHLETLTCFPASFLDGQLLKSWDNFHKWYLEWRALHRLWSAMIVWSWDWV